MSVFGQIVRTAITAIKPKPKPAPGKLSTATVFDSWCDATERYARGERRSPSTLAERAEHYNQHPRNSVKPQTFAERVDQINRRDSQLRHAGNRGAIFSPKGNRP
jgi:hypothetical protein